MHEAALCEVFSPLLLPTRKVGIVLAGGCWSVWQVVTTAGLGWDISFAPVGEGKIGEEWIKHIHQQGIHHLYCWHNNNSLVN
jgi:hypothetical protein